MEEAPAQAHGSRRAQLTMLAGAQLGRVFSLSHAVQTLGRTLAAEVCLPHPSVSRAHARVRKLDDGTYELEELGSRNGTRLNGELVHGRALLRSGDRIQLGARVLLQFSVVDQLDRRLREVENLETVGRLSAAVNHDLNNLLSVLTCGLSHLGTLDPSTSLGAADVVECVRDMQIAALRAGELTQRLNTLVRRPDAAVQERVDLSELCDEVVRMLKRILPEGIRVETQIEPNLWVDGNRAWLHQLLMNPCINARDSMVGLGSGGVLRIEVRAALNAEVAGRPDLEPGPHVLIVIADTGAGIPAEIMPQVFQPFFTTKGAGKGTGLGLATVARVANEHGGSIDLESKPGAGTTLRVFLPKIAHGQADTLRPSAGGISRAPAPPTPLTDAPDSDSDSEHTAVRPIPKAVQARRPSAAVR